jgi:hypothetical protein
MKVGTITGLMHQIGIFYLVPTSKKKSYINLKKGGSNHEKTNVSGGDYHPAGCACSNSLCKKIAVLELEML